MPLRVEVAGDIVANTSRGMRVLETSHPPVYYFPRDDVRDGFLAKSAAMRPTVCEFKGRCEYLALEHAGQLIDPGAWKYTHTVREFEPIHGWIGFYAKRADCFVGNVPAAAQDGPFYGGWITPDLAGPFKGGPGTWGW